MKIDNIDLVSSNGTTVSNFSFRNLNSVNPYNVKNIIGLDADEITPRLYGFSNLDSSKYYSLVPQKKQVVISVSLNPQFTEGETHSSLRDLIYKNISSSRTGLTKLVFKDGEEAIAEVVGFVIKFESLLFEREPAIKLTIECEDAILKSVDIVDVDVSDFDTLPIITDSLSTAPHGFDLGLTFTAGSNVFLIHDQVETGWQFNTIFNFITGDQLHFSSRQDNKQFYIVRGGSTIHLVDKLLTNAIWPILFPGENRFHVSIIPDGAFTWNYVRHYYSYWGV
jgi:hypothetical protein